MFAPRLDPKKFKVYLKLCVERMKMFQLKQENVNANTRREIAQLIEPKEELARIKTEQLIRDDYLIDAVGIMEIFVHLLQARMGLIEASRQCDPGMKEAICSILWSSPRLEAFIPELAEVRKGLVAHYGEAFVKSAMANQDGAVNQKLMCKLSIYQINPIKVEEYLKVIADKYHVNFKPREVLSVDDALSGGSDLGFSNPLYNTPLQPTVAMAPAAHSFDPLAPHPASLFPSAPGALPPSSGPYPPSLPYPPHPSSSSSSFPTPLPHPSPLPGYPLAPPPSSSFSSLPPPSFPSHSAPPSSYPPSSSFPPPPSAPYPPPSSSFPSAPPYSSHPSFPSAPPSSSFASTHDSFPTVDPMSDFPRPPSFSPDGSRPIDPHTSTTTTTTTTTSSTYPSSNNGFPPSLHPRSPDMPHFPAVPGSMGGVGDGGLFELSDPPAPHTFSPPAEAEFQLPSVPGREDHVEDGPVPEFDDLARRFEALRNQRS